MQGDAAILLPEGLKFVLSSEIPVLISTALHPEPVDTRRRVRQLIKCSKAESSSETAKWNGWPIDDDDRKVLDDIWREARLPRFQYPTFSTSVTEEEWQPYAAAFQNFGRNLDWCLDVVYADPTLNAGILWHTAREEHQKLLRNAIQTGLIRQLNPATNIATPSYLDNGKIPVTALIDYVREFAIDVRFVPLRSIIAPHADTSFDELPDALRVIVNATYQLIGWDLLSTSQRLAFAEQHDLQHDPRNRAENERIWSLLAEIRELENQAREWELLNPQSITEKATKDAKLKELRTEIENKTVMVQIGEQEQKKTSAGRYTLEQATDWLVREAGVHRDSILRKFLDAARDGSLAVYSPGSDERYRYTNDASKARSGYDAGADAKAVRPYYEEVHWDDINVWLEKYEPRISYRFPAPQSQSEQADNNQHAVPIEVQKRAALSDKGGEAAAINTKVRNEWDIYKRKQLLDEYNTSKTTQEELARKYGVTRPRISFLLKQAREEWEPKKKADAFSPLSWKQSKK